MEFTPIYPYWLGLFEDHSIIYPREEITLRERSSPVFSDSLPKVQNYEARYVG